MINAILVIVVFVSGIALGALIHVVPESPLRTDAKLAHMCGELSGLNKAMVNFGAKASEMPKGCEAFK